MVHSFGGGIRTNSSGSEDSVPAQAPRRSQLHAVLNRSNFVSVIYTYIEHPKNTTAAATGKRGKNTTDSAGAGTVRSWSFYSLTHSLNLHGRSRRSGGQFVCGAVHPSRHCTFLYSNGSPRALIKSAVVNLCAHTYEEKKR